MDQNIRNKLLALSEEKYKDFSQKLSPGAEEMLGVRLPNLRRLAKEIAKGNVQSYLAQDPGEYFEEIMLFGMVLGYADLSFGERWKEIEKFLPAVTNWSVCDSFCTGLPVSEGEREAVWEWLCSYTQREEEFHVRFAVVMMLLHYVDEAYLVQVLKKLDEINHPGYYAKMAVAWAVCECYVKFPEVTEKYLLLSHLAPFTYNKAIQKILESRRVSPEQRERLRGMKKKS